jgi:DNA-binding Xre family transcriptional regulator
MLAKRTGLTLWSVQRIGAGKAKQPSVWTIKAIAKVLGVSVDDLIDAEGR